MPRRLLLVLTLKLPLETSSECRGQENRSCSLIHHYINLGLQLSPAWPLIRVPQCWIVPSLAVACFQELFWGLELSSESDGQNQPCWLCVWGAVRMLDCWRGHAWFPALPAHDHMLCNCCNLIIVFQQFWYLPLNYPKGIKGEWLTLNKSS